MSSTSFLALSYTELPLVVLICSYNNAPWVTTNLDSVFSQNYTNYRILYIDDCSIDDTANYVRAYAAQHDHDHKLTLIANTERSRKMKNMFNAVHSCDDNEIIIQLDGDDWFCDTELFSHINHLYQTRDIWLTYGSYMDVPGNIRGYAEATNERIIQEKAYRSEPWLYMPTRTFYAWLFKQIDLKDFIAEQVTNYQGLFFPSADDPAFMFPMLEMAGTRFHFIDHISYVANRSNPLIGRSLEPTLQNACGCDVRQRKPYKTLVQAKKQSSNQTTTASMLIIVENIPSLTYLLDSMVKYAPGLADILLVHDPEIAAELTQLIKTYSFTCRLCTTPELLTSRHLSSSEYLLVASDTSTLVNELDISLYASHLAKTHAYGFYLAFSAHEPPFKKEHSKLPHITSQHVYQNIHAWKFNCGRTAIYNNIDMTLLRTETVIKQLNNIAHHNCVSVAHLKKEWLSANSADLHQVGLFLDEKIITSTGNIQYKSVPVPSCIELPEGRGYRSPADLDRKRKRKKRLQEKRTLPENDALAHERRVKKRTLPLS